MKYLKQFESVTDNLWLVVYEDPLEIGNNYQKLFDDRESAENFYLKLINDEFEKKFELRGEKFTEDKFVISTEEAEEYQDQFESSIYFYCIPVEKKFELPENIKYARKARKYNL
jgi:hypothetical protein